MDADHLIRAQAEAVAAACAALAAIYREHAEPTPHRWLEVAATELWRFSATRRLVDSPAAAWLALFDQPPGDLPRSLGIGLSGCITGESRRGLMSRIRQLIHSMGLAADEAREPDAKDAAPDLDVEGVLQASLLRDSRGGGGGDERGGAIMLGGLLKVDGCLDPSVDDDPLIAAMFAAIARAADDCIIQPIAVRRAMLARLSPARQRVLTLMVEGLTTQEISDRLERSPHTVHDHILGIFRIFGVNSRREINDLWRGRPVPIAPPIAAADPPIDIRVIAPQPHPHTQVQ